jgi:hypothetical protein
MTLPHRIRTARLPIRLTPFTAGTLCSGSTWQVDDVERLAHQVATVVIGQSRQVSATPLSAMAARVPLGPSDVIRSISKVGRQRKTFIQTLVGDSMNSARTSFAQSSDFRIAALDQNPRLYLTYLNHTP